MLNRFLEIEFQQKRNDLLKKSSSMLEFEKVVYGWVKQNKTSPRQMRELMIDGFEKFYLEELRKDVLWFQ